LQDAGYQLRNGHLLGKDGQAIKLQVLYPTSSTPRGKIAAYLQQQYKQLGIEVDVKSLDFNAYTEQVQNRHDFDISLAAYGGGSLDPDLGPRAQLITNGQQNVTGYSSPQVDELFKIAANERSNPSTFFRAKSRGSRFTRAIASTTTTHSWAGRSSSEVRPSGPSWRSAR
jgi:peptide/nickel transport system substrate-binding protein